MNPQNSKNPLGTGEIGTIRNILMGEQMSTYEHKFQEQQEQIAQLKAEFETNLNALATKTNEQITTLQKEVFDRLSQLESLLETQANRLDNKIENTSTEDKALIGKLLQEIGQKLL